MTGRSRPHVLSLIVIALAAVATHAQTFRVSLDPAVGYRAPGGKLQFAATVHRPDGTTVRRWDCGFQSGNPAVATVDDSNTNLEGTATAVAPGTAAITVQCKVDGSIQSAQASFTVRDWAVELRPPDFSIGIGAWAQYVVIVTQPDGVQVQHPPTGPTWISSNPSVATIAAGKAVPVALGDTTITAQVTLPNGAVKPATAVLHVREPKLDVTPKVARLAAGGSTQLAAAVTRPDGQVLPVNATWTSDNAAVAAVNGGVVTASGPGRATITAQFRTGDGVMRAATAVVQVWNAAIHPQRFGMKVGTSHLYQVRVYQPDAVLDLGPQHLANWSSRFESSNPAIASIDGAGNVMARAAGGVTLVWRGRAPQSGVDLVSSTTLNVAAGYSLYADQNSIETPLSSSVGATLTGPLVVYIRNLDGTSEWCTTCQGSSDNTLVVTVRSHPQLGWIWSAVAGGRATLTFTNQFRDGTTGSLNVPVTVSP